MFKLKLLISLYRYKFKLKIIMKKIKLLLMLVIATFVFSSCTLQSHSMKMPSNHVEFHKDDFTFSKQVSGEATEVKILGIDWARLLAGKKYGEVSEAGKFQIPIIGGLIANKVNMYALYNVMKDNPGYDVVFYPQFETHTSGIPIIWMTTKVKVTARLAKIK